MDKPQHMEFCVKCILLYTSLIIMLCLLQNVPLSYLKTSLYSAGAFLMAKTLQNRRARAKRLYHYEHIRIYNYLQLSTIIYNYLNVSWRCTLIFYWRKNTYVF